MNKKFILALMLTTGMAFAQTGGSASTPDQQTPPQQPRPSTTSPSTSPFNGRSDEFKHDQHQ